MGIARLQGRMVFCSSVEKTAKMLETILGFVRAYEYQGDVALTIEPVGGDGIGIEYYLHPSISRFSDNLGTFEVDDVDEDSLAFVAWGCQIIGGPEDTPWGTREAYVRDSDGHELTLRTLLGVSVPDQSQ